MPSQRGFGDDGTKATRFYRPDDDDHQMNEMTRISYIPASYQNLKTPGIQADFVIHGPRKAEQHVLAR
jgi:hypothetical protein